MTIKYSLVFLLACFFVSACRKDKHEDPPATVNINYPAAYVVNGGSNTISVISLGTDEVKETLKLGEVSSGGHGGHTGTGVTWPHHIYLNPSGTRLAIGAPGMDLSAGHHSTGTGAGKLVIMDALTGAILKVISLPAMNHNAVFSPDGSEIWTSQMDTGYGKVLVYDSGTYTLKSSVTVGKSPAEVTFSADGSKAYVANTGSMSVTVISPAAKTVLATISTGEDPVGAWPGTDGKMYVDNERSKTITVIDAATSSVTDTVDLGFMPGMAAYNNSGPELWVSDPQAGKVHYFLKGGKGWVNAGSIATGPGAHAIAFSGNGSKAYITNQLGASVSVIDVAGKTKIKDITVGQKPNGVTVKN
jgi:YVTN family beta-propeller protein